MDDRTPSYNLRKELEIEPYVLEPPLRELDKLLYEMASEIGKKARIDKASLASINMLLGYLGYLGDNNINIRLTKGDMVYLNDIDDPLGETIGACIMGGYLVPPNKIVCYNNMDKNNRRFEIPNPYSGKIRETVEEALRKLYWEINKGLREELYRLGYTPYQLEIARPFMFSRLRANIPLNQQPGNPQIEIIANDEDRGTIRYKKGRSELNLNYLFYDFS